MAAERGTHPMRCLPLALRTAFLVPIALPAVATAGVEFTGAPHMLAFEQRQQVVLFVSGPLGGAMATRRSDGSFDVTVPNAGAADELLGREFTGPEIEPGGAATTVVIERVSGRDVRIRIRPAGDVARLVPRVAVGPPRLMIDLFSSVEAAMAEEAATAGSRTKPPPSRRSIEGARQ